MTLSIGYPILRSARRDAALLFGWSVFQQRGKALQPFL